MDFPTTYEFFAEVYMQELVIVNFLTWLEAPTLNLRVWHSSKTFIRACLWSPTLQKLKGKLSNDDHESYMKKITGRTDQITLRKALMVALNKFVKDYPLEEMARQNVLASFRAK